MTVDAFAIRLSGVLQENFRNPRILSENFQE